MFEDWIWKQISYALHTLANVLLSDGVDLNQELVKEGGIGGIRSMRQGIRCWKGWKTKHERRGKGCGQIRTSAGAAGVEALDKFKALENAVADYESVYQVAKIPIATSPANTRLAATSARRSFIIVTSIYTRRYARLLMR